MTLQNRVLPTGDIVAVPSYGDLMGNRGILHDEVRQLGTARWTHPNWVTCLLEYKGRKRELMAPGRYTELFFLDEATALAAGHRPCGECRKTAFAKFRAAWNAAHGDTDLRSLDKRLHRDRVSRTRQQIRYDAYPADLPDGTFILHNDTPHVVHGNIILRYEPSGYTASATLPQSLVQVLTPACTVATLAQGYRPELHRTAAISR
ncbi:MAG: hypothetical protein RID23_06070 [Roseovarius sp.]